MNELEKRAKHFADSMKEQGYEVSNDFAMNFVTLKDKNPNLSNEELIEQSFKKTLAFYDEFEKNPKPYTNEIYRQLIEEELNEELNKIGLKADIYETDDWIDEDRMYEGKIVTNDPKEIEYDGSLTGRYVDLNSVKEELEGYINHSLKKEFQWYYQNLKEKDLNSKIDDFTKEINSEGFAVDKNWTSKFLNLNENNPKLSAKEHINNPKSSFLKSGKFVDEFNNDPNKYLTVEDREKLIKDINKKPFKLKEKSKDKDLGVELKR